MARVYTGLALGAILTGAVVLLPTPGAAAALALLWLVGAWEWAGFARARVPGRGIYVVAVAVAIAAGLYWPLGDDGAAAISLTALTGWGLALYGILTFPRELPVPLVVAFGFVALVPSWLLLAYLHGAGAMGPGLALTGLAIVWAADIGAFFIGRSIGRVKLAPRVSPGKTWEGVAGGVAAAAAVGWLASLVLGLSAATLVPIAGASALVSVVGDLTVSMLKRNVGLKDSGRILPGHGGVMDRIDGLVAALPIYTIGLKFAGLLPSG